jgi:hypothetical protein
MRVGPRAGDQPAVPAQQRLRLDEEAGPAGSGQDAADRGEQGPVGRFQPGTRDLATQDRKLVAQHHDLQVLGGITAGCQREQLDGTTQGQVGKVRQHPEASDVPASSGSGPPVRSSPPSRRQDRRCATPA